MQRSGEGVSTTRNGQDIVQRVMTRRNCLSILFLVLAINIGSLYILSLLTLGGESFHANAHNLDITYVSRAIVQLLDTLSHPTKTWANFPIRVVNDTLSPFEYGYNESLIDPTILKGIHMYTPQIYEQLQAQLQGYAQGGPRVMEPRNGLCKHQGKVFIIGLMKTGTTSVAKALDILGYKCSKKSCIHLGLWKYVSDTTMVWKSINDIIMDIFQHPQLLQSFRKDTFGALAFGDSPWCFLFPIFDQWYPNSKFILTVRDSHVQMAVSHINYLKRTGKSYAKSGLLDEEFAMLVARRYELHNQFVIDYFQKRNRSHDLLVLNLDAKPPSHSSSSLYSTLSSFLLSKRQSRTGHQILVEYWKWKPLINFLGCNPKIIYLYPFPHMNKSKSSRIDITQLSDAASLSMPVLNWRLYFGATVTPWVAPYVVLNRTSGLLGLMSTTNSNETLFSLHYSKTLSTYANVHFLKIFTQKFIYSHFFAEQKTRRGKKGDKVFLE
ncbi:hypothetical protein RFI_04154 [Reticulomyxa filosa]|uniref:Sulfotransferase domain-containing protein n=1 Tax=Reticulomyxa filosa TaxID=46433 RepID=X6P4A3_RETFI|nr:hypothetical protein RFI_04154 [Reticulomyxa filosa]|eukprot:ETO32953.1 hypothetical protein RFI_04154 [Reticulomyxa filosa]